MVGQSVTVMSSAKNGAEPVEMLFGMRCHLGCGIGWARI